MKSNDKYRNCEYYPFGTSNQPFRYATKPFLDHFCLPSGAYLDSEEMKQAFTDVFFESVLGDEATKYIYDIARSWAVILVASACSIVIAYIYLFMIRLFGGFIIWISVALTIAVLVAAGVYSYLYARPQYSVDDPTHNYLAYAAYVCWGLAGLVVLALIFCLNAI